MRRGTARAEAAPATRQAVEAWRDRTFRRLPPLRVRGERSARAFVDAVGFCFTLSDFGLPVASLYVAVCGRRHPRWPRHTHHDPEIGLAWSLKDSLPAQRLAYYGKLVKGRPTLVSLELLPAFCALIRGGRGSGDYLLDYRQGRMSRPGAVPGRPLRGRGRGDGGRPPGPGRGRQAAARSAHPGAAGRVGPLAGRCGSRGLTPSSPECSRSARGESGPGPQCSRVLSAKNAGSGGGHGRAGPGRAAIPR